LYGGTPPFAKAGNDSICPVDILDVVMLNDPVNGVKDVLPFANDCNPHP
jgi:hypothetical protein